MGWSRKNGFVASRGSVRTVGLHQRAVHTSDLADIPCRNVLIEGTVSAEHRFHACDLQAS